MLLSFLRKYWGCPPLLLSLGFLLGAYFAKRNAELHLRYVPAAILVWLLICSLFAFFLWGMLTIRKWLQNEGSNLEPTHFSSIIALGILLCIAGWIVTSFIHREQVTFRYDICMVARTQKFSKNKIDYYEYVNVFFYGKHLGTEYYGDYPGISDKPLRWEFMDLEGNIVDSGPNKDLHGFYVDNSIEESSNNLHDPEMEISDLAIDIMEHRENELVFTISIEDFIAGYNYYYKKDHDTDYLLPSNKWRSWTEETSIHSNHETKFYYFTEDEKIWPLPTMTVYVPTDGEYIQEITLNYDWHSHTENMFKLHKQMCIYALKVFFPELSDNQLTNLCTEIIDIGYENAFSTDEWYSNSSVPHVIMVPLSRPLIEKNA